MGLNYRKFLRRLFKIVLVIIGLHLLALVYFYFAQEKFFFNPKFLGKDYIYNFSSEFEEIEIAVDHNINLNALLFCAKNSKGLVLYYHGNAGALHDWGKRANLYTKNGYDVLFFDYRGYGKSDGNYKNTAQLLNDTQKVYDYAKKWYDEKNIVVLGYSLGSGLAAYAASQNNPKQLILEAPYYSWKNLISEDLVPPLPSFLVRYDIPTFSYLSKLNMPISIFYGTKDYLVRPDTNAKKLKELYPNKIKLYPIAGSGHNQIYISKTYYDILSEILK